MVVLDQVIIILYLLGIVAIGVLSMKKINSFDDYALAGRSMPMALLFATMAATATGGGSTIGRVSYVYDTGLIIFIATLAYAANQILAGLYVAPRMREMGNSIYTVGDIMGYYYGRSGRFLTGIFTFVYCVSIFGVQLLAMGRVLQTVTGFPLIPMTIVASIATVAYTWAGGMFAVIFTDAVQFIILAFGIATAAVLVMHDAGGVSTIMTKLDAAHLSLTADWPMVKVLGFALAFLLGEALAPFFVQRYLTTKSAKDTKWGVTVFGVYYILFSIVVIVIGLAGAILLPNISPDLVLTNVVRDYLPIGITGLVFGALLAAIMSTGDSLLNTAATIFTRDIYQKFVNPNAKDADLLKISKVATMVVGVGGIIAAISIPRVLDLMVYTWNLWAPSILPPLVIALMWGKTLERKVSPYAGPCAIIAGFTMTMVWGPKILGEPYGIPALVMGLAANLIVFIIVQMLTSSKTPKGAYVPEEIDSNKIAA